MKTIELKCEPKDVMYVANWNDGWPYVDKVVCESFSIDEFGSDYGFRDANGNLLVFHEEEFGEVIFNTLKEAEVELTAMKGMNL